MFTPYIIQYESLNRNHVLNRKLKIPKHHISVIEHACILYPRICHKWKTGFYVISNPLRETRKPEEATQQREKELLFAPLREITSSEQKDPHMGREEKPKFCHTHCLHNN